MPWALRPFPSYKAWLRADRRVGGYWPINPHQARRQQEQSIVNGWNDCWPDRYRSQILAGTLQSYWFALPGGRIWCPWMRAYNAEQHYYGEGWDVLSTSPFSFSPSINAPPYHGYITNGYVTDGDRPFTLEGILVGS